MAEEGRESSKGSRPLLAQVKTSVEEELQLYTSITMNSNKFWSFGVSLCSSGYQNIPGSFLLFIIIPIIAVNIVVALVLFEGERKIPLWNERVTILPFSGLYKIGSLKVCDQLEPVASCSEWFMFTVLICLNEKIFIHSPQLSRRMELLLHLKRKRGDSPC